jgi:hypothetical protein
LIVAGLCLSWGAAACWAQEKADSVKALRKERRELLSEVATGLADLYIKFPVPEAIHPTFQEVFQAERDSFKADLDYFDKSKDRIEAIETHTKAANRLLQVAESLVARARETRLTEFQVKAYTLEVQIELLKEKERQKK